MPLDSSILGQGIYSPRQAARLVGSTAQEVLRWTRGSGPSEPLWHAYYQSIDDSTELSFADLVELRVVKAFRRAGISLQAIRFAISFAESTYGIERPLSSLEFRTDGQEILMHALDHDENLVSLSSKRAGQKVFSDIVKQSLRDLEYEAGIATRWRPHSAPTVVIDPNRQFGQPVLDIFGVSTGIIYSESRHFNDIDYISKVYEIPRQAVAEAIRYESSLEEAHGKSPV